MTMSQVSIYLAYLSKANDPGGKEDVINIEDINSDFINFNKGLGI
jgi:hypothetical protein